jgi:hypothetical protein
VVLDIVDEPGPLTSTALLPPGTAPPRHPFLTAAARDADHEHELRELLLDSTSTEDFAQRLRRAGFSVEEVASG